MKHYMCNNCDCSSVWEDIAIKELTKFECPLCKELGSLKQIQGNVPKYRVGQAVKDTTGLVMSKSRDWVDEPRKIVRIDWAENWGEHTKCYVYGFMMAGSLWRVGEEDLRIMSSDERIRNLERTLNRLGEFVVRVMH